MKAYHQTSLAVDGSTGASFHISHHHNGLQAARVQDSQHLRPDFKVTNSRGFYNPNGT